ncbi:MAG: CHC2 zinc finger domain-containing protein [Bacteroidetes bacterium]|nr:CHC2 zinc finger domain-containing protein [Bacteroidota bacterium]
MPGPTINPIEEIKARLSIVEVISPHVPLKKAGRNFKGLCPFHTEKTPSFIVFPDQGSYHCFGCSAGGDIFTFVMKTQNLEFGDALRMLADRAGVVLPEHRATPEQEEAHRRLYELTAAAAGYFQHLLLHAQQSDQARRYLEKREVSAATIESFQLGYALDDWEALGRYLAGKGYSSEEMVQAGLAVKRENSSGQYDRFRNRIVFPIRDLKGRIVGFGGRVLDDTQPKYLNSSDTPHLCQGR